MPRKFEDAFKNAEALREFEEAFKKVFLAEARGQLEAMGFYENTEGETIMNDQDQDQKELGQAVADKLVQKFIETGANGLQVTILHQEQEMPSPLSPFNYKGVRHNLQSVEALVSLITRLGSVDYSIVYFNDKNINAILDRERQNRPFDVAAYPFEVSIQAERWQKVFDSKMGQKDFIKFLKGREPGELDCLDTLIAAAQKIKGTFNVVSESNYEDSNNVSMCYTVEERGKKDEGYLVLPTKLTVLMPLLKGSEDIFEVEMELELHKPVDGRPPTFEISCPRWPIFWQKAVDKVVIDLQASLPDHLVIAGAGFITQ